MKVYGISNVVVDNYFIDNNYNGTTPGGTVFNILANLSSFGIKTELVGEYGDDKEGYLGFKMIEKVNVGVNQLRKSQERTKRINVVINETRFRSSKYRCPMCKKKIKTMDLISKEFSEKIRLNKNKIILFDNAKEEVIKIIKSLKDNKTKALVDIGYVSKLGNVEDLYNIFNIVQLNGRVAIYLMNKYNYKDYKELNKLFNSELLIITLSERGAKYIFEGKQIFKKIINPEEELDPSGAGDAFYSVLIKNYINSNCEVTEKIINESFEEGTKLAAMVVKNIGAISHIIEFEKIFNTKCNCEKANYEK